MRFAHPLFLAFLALLLPLAAWTLARQERRRRAALDDFGEQTLLSRSSALPDARRRAIGHALWLVVLALALVALARPQFGKRPASLARTGRDVLVLLDLSRSMTAADLLPSRLEAAKRAVTEVIAASPGDRVGLVVFGGSAFLQLPLTADHSTGETFLRAATPDDLGDPATNVSAALETAATTFEHEGERGYQAVVLVSDGESGEGDLEPVLQRLKNADVPVFAIGAGTAVGAPVPADSVDYPEKYHRDNIGRVVIARLGETDLRRIATETRGGYTSLGDPNGLRTLAADLAKLDTRTLTTRPASQRADRFQWPLGLAVAALAFEPLVRRRRGGGGGSGSGGGAFSRSLALSALLLLAAACGTGFWQARRGERLYEAGSYAESYAAFEKALAATGDPRLAYNAATALYRMHRYEESGRRFREVVDTSRPGLKQRAFYNMGNAYVRMAEDKPDDQEPLRRAIAAYEEALRLDPADVDAKWNLELAVKRLGEDRESGGSGGRHRRGDSGRGNMNESEYEGTPEAAVGAMAGGGQGSGGDESAEELSESEARQLLEALERQQLTTHEGRRAARPNTGDQDW